MKQETNYKSKHGILAFIILIVLVVSLIALLTMADQFQVKGHFTEFYILDINNIFKGNTLDVVENQPVLIRIGIANHEGVKSNYQISVNVGGNVIASVSNIILADNGITEQPIQFSLKTVGENQKVNILLSLQGSSFPYRSLSLFINVKPASP